MATLKHNHSEDSPFFDVSVVDRDEIENSSKFQEFYELQPDFIINCKECCWTFLVKDRQYMCEYSTGHLDCVTYGKKPYSYTECYLCMGPKHGQLKTEKLPESPPQSCFSVRAVHSGHTYQLYCNDDHKTIGTSKPVIARLESIALSKKRNTPIFSQESPFHKVEPYDLEQEEIAGACMKYHYAALLELFRLKCHQNSLNGTVWLQIPLHQKEMLSMSYKLGKLNIK